MKLKLDIQEKQEYAIKFYNVYMHEEVWKSIIFILKSSNEKDN